MDNLILPTCKSSTGKITFFIFEIAAAAVFFLGCAITAICLIKGYGFIGFLSDISGTISSSLILFGIAKIVDLLFARHEHDIGFVEESKKQKNTEEKTETTPEELN